MLTFKPQGNHWSLNEQIYLLRLLFSFPKKHFSLTCAFSWFPDFRQILSMCKLKFSLSSIVMPSMSTYGTYWICSEPMRNLTSVLFYLRLSNTMVLNLSRFTVILFSWNHLMATLHSDYNVYFKLSIVFAILLKLLSSAMFWTDAIKINNRKSLKNRLHKVCPTIELWGTPDIIFCKLLFSLFIRTHCFLLSKYE